MIAIVAADRNGAIGAHGDLLVKLHADMKNFRSLTNEKVLIYGRKTLDTFPGQKPLPHRVNMVLSRTMPQRKDAYVAQSIEEMIEATRNIEPDSLAVIGGAQVYQELEPHIDTVYLTRIDRVFPEADAFFFSLEGWKEEPMSEWMEEDGTRFRFLKYTR